MGYFLYFSMLGTGISSKAKQSIISTRNSCGNIVCLGFKIYLFCLIIDFLFDFRDIFKLCLVPESCREKNVKNNNNNFLIFGFIMKNVKKVKYN